jgi:hypothetical protein
VGAKEFALLFLGAAAFVPLVDPALECALVELARALLLVDCG